MCVNVLMFGPVTADMLVRGCQPGVNCKKKKKTNPGAGGARHGDKQARGACYLRFNCKFD